MIIETGLFLVSCVIIYLFAVFMHESGHIYYLTKFNGKKPKVRINKKTIIIGVKEDYLWLTDKQRRTVYITGVVYGLIPLFIMSSFNIYYGFLMPLYMWGSRRDIHLFLETFERLRK